MSPELIAKWIRDIRDRHRLSQDQLAERCGVSQSVVSDAERGRSNMRQATLARIAATMGEPLPSVSPSEVLEALVAGREQVRDLRQKVTVRSEVLARCAEVLDRVAASGSLAMELVSVVQGAASAAHDYEHVGREHADPAFDLLQWGAVPPLSRLKESRDLMAAIDQLVPADRLLVAQLVTRLSGEMAKQPVVQNAK